MVSFYSKAVGVSHTNRDGSSRQQIIKKHCKNKMQVFLIPEPDNPSDGTAIALYRQVKGFFSKKEYQIGYLKSLLAEEVTLKYNSGKITKAEAKITEITGGSYEMPRHGVNIQITLT